MLAFGGTNELRSTASNSAPEIPRTELTKLKIRACFDKSLDDVIASNLWVNTEQKKEWQNQINQGSRLFNCRSWRSGRQFPSTDY
jgi:hypothetical protein